MTEPKRNPNPFVRMAQEAKAKKTAESEIPHNHKVKSVSNIPKATKGFGGKLFKKTGRGG